MSRTHIPLAFIIAVLLSVMAATSATAAEASPSAAAPIPTDTAEGVTWQLQQQLVDGELQHVPDGVVITLLMEGGNAGGEGGCNTYSGSYTLEGSALTFGPLISTQMACLDPSTGEASTAMTAESAYFANLALTASWFSDGGSLTLQDPAGETTLVFGPAAEVMPTDSIEGITWQLVSYAVGGGGKVAVPEGVIATLMLQAGQAGGSGGCNAFTTDYTLDGSSITFGTVTSTQMFCEGPSGDVETIYFATLPLVTGWFSDGGGLTLTDDGRAGLGFVPAPTASIEGGWVATGINNGQDAVVTTDLTSLVTAVFDGGSLSGSDGCNQYSTTYTLEGDHIAISPDVISTRMACSDELDAQAQQYIAALRTATTWSVDPARGLELRDDSGALQVSYAAAVG